MADTSGLPPEGWYPDRPNATRLRHWTGTGWTNEFRPLDPEPAPTYAPVRETTDPVLSRRELRTQSAYAPQGEPGPHTSAIPIIVPVAAPAPAAPVAPSAPVVASLPPVIQAPAVPPIPQIPVPPVPAPQAPLPQAPAPVAQVPAPQAPAAQPPVIAPVAQEPVVQAPDLPPAVQQPFLPQVPAPAPTLPPVAALPPVAPAVVAPPVVAAPEPAIPSYAPIRPQTWQESFADKAPRPTGSSQTLAGWLYAISPIWIAALVIVGMTLLTIVNPRLVQAGLGVVGFAMTFLLARQDIRSLTDRGYRAPSAWWILLPLVYFVIRVIRVGARSLAMLLVFLLSSAALGVLLYVLFIGNPTLLSTLVPSTATETTSSVPTPVATLSAQQRADFLTPDGVKAQLKIELAQTFDVGSIDCVPFPSTDAGTTTTCVVVLNGVSYNAGLEVTPDQPDKAFVVTGMLPAQG